MMAASPLGQAPIALREFLFLSMEHGLRQALFKLSALHRSASGPWLDEIENEVVQDLKGTSAEGVGMIVEASASAVALLVVEDFFEETRNELKYRS
jgi:hypothetical protein